MELWHRSIVATPVGTHLLPMAYWHANDPKVSFVFFHETREGAMKWGRSPLCGFALYRTDSADVEGLEPHPQTPRIWKTRLPVNFALLDLVERDENPNTLPNLRDMLETRARELGTFP